MTGKTDMLQKNLEVLRGWMTDESFRRLSEAAEPTEAVVEPALPEEPVFCWSDPEGVKYFHSKRGRRDEAERQVSSWAGADKPDWGGVVAVLGFGAMTHVESIVRRAAPGGAVFVADPNPGVVKKFLRTLDLGALKKDGVDVRLGVSENARETARELRSVLSGRDDYSVSFFIHPNTARIFPEKCRRLLDEMTAQSRIEAMNRGTRMMFEERWLNQIIENLPEVLSERPVNRLKDAFAGKTAVVAGAGPSLNAATSLIRDGRDKCVILAAGRALKPLLKNGITPDFVVSVDCDPELLAQYEGVEVPPGVILLTCMTGYPPIIEKFKGRTVFFSTDIVDGVAAWLGELGLRPDPVKAGGTVAVSALDLAVYMGFDKIVMCGVDLAFGADGASHADGAVRAAGDEAARREMVEVPGNNGGMVPTTMQFRIYTGIISAFLQDAAKSHRVEFINTAAGGAKFEGSKFADAAELGRVLGDSPPAGDRAAVVGARLSREAEERPDAAFVSGEISKTLVQLEELARLAGRAAEIYKDILERRGGGEIPESAMAELEGLEAQIKIGNYGKLLVKNALQVIFSHVQRDMKGCTDTGVTLAGSHDFYKAMSESAQTIRRLLQESAMRVTKQKGA